MRVDSFFIGLSSGIGAWLCRLAIVASTTHRRLAKNFPAQAIGLCRKSGFSWPKAGPTPGSVQVPILQAAMGLAALNFLAGFQVFDLNFLLGLGVFFHDVSPGCCVDGCELSLAPNNKPFPPVTRFFGMRSSNRMPEGRLGPGLAE